MVIGTLHSVSVETLMPKIDFTVRMVLKIVVPFISVTIVAAYFTLVF